MLDNVKRDGLLATYKNVQDRLDNFKQLGYSSAGVVVESGGDTSRLATVLPAPALAMPRTRKSFRSRATSSSRCRPKSVAFTTVAAIAMHGVHQADVRVGEQVVVIGLGLVGLLTVQLLKGSGCRVMGMDITPRNLELALA